MTNPVQDPIRSEFSDDPEMVEIIEMFIDELPDRVDALDSAWRAARREDVGRIAHQLKGAGAGYGFACVGQAAGMLEAALADASKDLDDVRAEFDALINLCRRVAS